MQIKPIDVVAVGLPILSLSAIPISNSIGTFDVAGGLLLLGGLALALLTEIIILIVVWVSGRSGVAGIGFLSLLLSSAIIALDVMSY